MTSVTLDLNDDVVADLDEIAKQLGITQAEVIRKGLLVMGLYAEMKRNKKGSLILKNDEEQTERQLELT